MTLTRYHQPWGLMNQLHNELNRMFEGRESEEGGVLSAADWVPAVDIKEEAERFVLTADIPGVDPKDIDITMEDGMLTLRGERQGVNEEEKNGFRRLERVRGTFYRRFSLPDTADAEGISARSEHGVLEVVIPKQAKVQPRRITVKA